MEEVQKVDAVRIWYADLGWQAEQVAEEDDIQFYFMVGKSTTGAIFIIQQLPEKYIKKKKL